MDGAVTVPFNDGRAVTAPLYGVRRRTIMNGFWQLHSASLSALLIGLRSQRQVQRQVFSTAGGQKISLRRSIDFSGIQQIIPRTLW